MKSHSRTKHGNTNRNWRLVQQDESCGCSLIHSTVCFESIAWFFRKRDWNRKYYNQAFQSLTLEAVFSILRLFFPNEEAIYGKLFHFPSNLINLASQMILACSFLRTMMAEKFGPIFWADYKVLESHGLNPIQVRNSSTRKANQGQLFNLISWKSLSCTRNIDIYTARSCTPASQNHCISVSTKNFFSTKK